MTRDESRQLPPLLAGIPPDHWPEHVAIIMDGNGRWARRRGLPRVVGHQQGVQTVRRIVEDASRIGLRRLTLFAFSHENWQRPRDEVDALMAIYEQYLRSERSLIMDESIRFVNIGRREALPQSVRHELEETERLSAGNRGMTLCLAVNYGGRQEIVDAARRLAEDAVAGRIIPDDIDEEAVASRLYPRGAVELDLLVRTAGEMRVSNFLLWQISYAELHVSPVLWPDFSEEDLHKAVADFAGRERRFGKVEPQAD